ncbi:TetR/AcrR family transcriptional regulator [Xinfangfangia sp. D13-10-4-6]|uniref:TetR/AcrR family transcriptional regulator n=1 Tax=Pseudogemmobacter hezensis TaxID=2737662 RepID=UPI001555E68C|nr:TetR/AcrR family transcriptional regulator [Pseudogemmobacter hezensis]NPD14899.1 TetR/AcrR family transcriptional regulator [Pseudogemmobacter hezensis]
MPRISSSSSRADEPRTRGPSPDKTRQTRKQILQAARDELTEHGFSGSTMAGVAGRAGLAKGTAYRYFVSKEALFLGLMQDLVADPLREARAQMPSPSESINAYCRRVLLPLMRVIEESGRAEIARIAITESRSFPELTATYSRDVYLPFHRHLEMLVTEAVSRGELPAAGSQHVPHLLSGALWVGMIQNGILASDQPVAIGDVFECQLDCVFGPDPQNSGAN